MKPQITYLAEPNPAALDEAIRRASEAIKESGLSHRLRKDPSRAIEYADRWQLSFPYDLPPGKMSFPSGVKVEVSKNDGTARMLQGR